MKSSLKVSFLTILTLTAFIVGGFLLAGEITNNISPVPTGYTLEDIYNLIQNNTATEADHSFSPAGAPGSSMHSVSEIYVALANLIDPSKLSSDAVQYLGVTGNTPVTPVDSVSKSFEPDSPAGTNTGYTLKDIENLIANERITSPSHSFAPASSPAPTSMSLTEIYNALSSLINSDNVALGTTYLGVAGGYTAEFCGGTGTAEDPYQICNWTQLSNIRIRVGSDFHYILNNDLSSADPGYGEWGPIGDDVDSFAGSFEGNNHTISDLVINRGNQASGGFFGFFSGSVSNLTLANIDATFSHSSGGLVGNQAGGIISNCHVSGTITGGIVVGGLVGDQTSSGIIEDSSADVNITASSAAGGLVGSVRGAVRRSYSMGGVYGYDTVGGLAGQCEGEISNSYSFVSAQGNTAIGGLVGRISSCAVSNSYSYGLVDSSSAGGLIGASSPGSGSVTDSYWDIETSGQATSAGGVGTTTAAMQNQSTYSNWDFDTIWNISGDYPFLR